MARHVPLVVLWSHAPPLAVVCVWRRFFCGVGNLPFIIAGACVALFLFAAVAHTCPWRGPNKPKLAPLSNLTTYTPGLEVRAWMPYVRVWVK